MLATMAYSGSGEGGHSEGGGEDADFHDGLAWLIDGLV